MTFLYIAIGLILAGIIGFLLFDDRKTKKVKAVSEQLLRKFGTITKDQQKVYLQTINNKYHVYYYKAPYQAEITINSKTMWDVRTKIKDVLVDQSRFFKDEMAKLFIVYDNVQSIKRYVNEHEMVFVNFDFFEDMFIIRFEELEKFLSEGKL